MNRLRIVLFLAVCLVFVRSASADDIHLIFDPTPAQVGSLYLVQSPGTDYTVSWVSCSSAGIPTTMAGDSACLGFLNETGADITSLNLSFTVPTNSVLVGQTVMCSNLDSSLTTNNCDSYNTGLTAGENVMLNFSGGTPIPNYMAFFIAEDGVLLGDMPDVVISTPEPGTLLLLSMGLGFIGLMMGGLKRGKLLVG